MSDPLSLLREQFINKKALSHDDTHITIGDLKFLRATPTPYKQDRGKPRASSPDRAAASTVPAAQLPRAGRAHVFARNLSPHRFLACGSPPRGGRWVGWQIRSCCSAYT